MGLTATVLGASGYSGAELLRYLSRHPAIDVVGLAGGTTTGRPVSQVLPHLTAVDGALGSIGEVASTPADVLFSCLPSGSFPDVHEARVAIDLSDEHRASPDWTYGLTEHGRDAIRAATRVANPGCYPTATLLCLVPFAAAGVIEGPVVVDALSGTSGAGRSKEDHLLHAAVDGNVTAYGSVTHRHVPEMERGLAAFGDLDVTVSFTPHLVPMSRGVLVTARAPLTATLSDRDALEVLNSAYEGEEFVTPTDGWPATKAVSGSNHALVSARVDERSGFLVASAAVDNLGKGAAGQAIQNANLMLGLDENAGLSGAGMWP